MCLRAFFLRQIFLRGFHTKTIAEFTLTCYHSHTSARKSAPQKHCIRPSSPQIREYIVTNNPHCAFLRMHHAGCFYILEDICRAGAAAPFPQGVPLHFTESKDNQLKCKIMRSQSAAFTPFRIQRHILALTKCAIQDILCVSPVHFLMVL